MLKIPTAGDRPPPLVMPLRTPPREEVTVEAMALSDGRRRKRKSRRGEDHSWDRSAGAGHHSYRHERKQMIGWLVAGSALLVSIVAAVLAAMHGSPRPTVERPVKPKAAPPLAKVAGSSEGPSDLEFSAMAEPLARKFLEARSVDELLPLVRNPLVAAERMKAFYPEGKVDPEGMSKFNIENEIHRDGEHLSVKVRTKNFKERSMCFFTTKDGLRVDWESWTAWSEMPWSSFLASKPAKAMEFRVNLSKVDYYNTGFTDDAKWRSYQISVPDQERSVYGYVERGSLIDQKLDLPSDETHADFTLKLRFPENARSDNQVLIEQVVSESWVIDNQTSP